MHLLFYIATHIIIAYIVDQLGVGDVDGGK